MKQITIILIILLCRLGASAQSITDFFYMLPEEYCYKMTVETRKEMVSDYVTNGFDGEDPGYFKVKLIDSPNGYLSLLAAFSVTYEICYWNISESRKLVGVCSNGCGPVCYNKYLVFYNYADGKLTQVEEILIPNIEFFKFFKDDVKISDVMRFYEASNSFTFQLPRVGKDIICHYEWDLSFDDATVKKYMKGDKMDLIWNNGNFITGTVHW
jgi:hypothetical protein